MAISPIPQTRNTLLFPGRLRRIIERIGAVVYPNAMCGFLIGASDGTTTFIEEVTHAQNLNRRRADEPVAPSPEDFRHAERIAAENELEIVGIWQSRPDGDAAPERTDLDAALSQIDIAGPTAAYSYVTVSVAADRGIETHSWRLDGDGFAEEEVQS